MMRRKSSRRLAGLIVILQVIISLSGGSVIRLAMAETGDSGLSNTQRSKEIDKAKRLADEAENLYNEKQLR